MPWHRSLCSLVLILLVIGGCTKSSRPRSSATTSTASTATAAAADCRPPPGAGSGRPIDADVVDLVNSPGIGRGPVGGYGDVAPVHVWLAAHPDVNAGLYVAGAHIWVGFTRNAEKELAAVRRETGKGATIRAFRATYSQAELDPLMQRITADRDELARQGLQVSTITNDVLTNRVQVMLARVDAQACQLMQQRYGSRRFSLVEGAVRAAGG